MMKHDARSLSEESLELLRRQAHRLRLEGRTWAEIASIVGVHMSTLMSWVRRFKIGTSGLSEVSSARRGRRFGENRTISLADELMLRELIVTGSPSQLGLPFALWNRRAVQGAIEVKFGLDMSIRTVGEYLRRWGFTPQRPVKRAIEQRPEQVQQWLKADYPALVRKALAQGGEIYWGDETAIKQDTAWVRGYAKAGQTPVLQHNTRWKSLTLISALTNQGLVRFALHEGAINSERFIDFLQALTDDAKPRKVFLIVDNLRVHHAIKVKEWLVGKEEKIEIHYLPPYSPETNPDEILNRDLKTELRTRPAAKDSEALKTMARTFIEKLIGMPERVVRYFRIQSVAYASSAAANACI
jgi:transposase